MQTPSTFAEILDNLTHNELRHDGPYDAGHWADAIARRKHLEDMAGGPRVLQQLDLLRYERIRAEHLAALRHAVRYRRIVARWPDGAAKDRAIVFASDTIESEKLNLKVWSGKVDDLRARLALPVEPGARAAE